ncbi:uncharacterized protein LOC127799691 [Diospyros lotus]|uniref:uncharacterized protein LOC127799691 n=1 Tax=Diospyros lotus TaxID=55363 RepID=UPI00224E5C10|nr:uncharacterized protein LOC127799691 [Diospyros lotus]
MAEVRGTLAGMMRTMERLATNQARQELAGRETEGNPIGSNEEQTPTSEAQRSGGNDNANGQLLKNFMASHPPEFCGGVDAIVVENWMMAMEKHLQAIGCADVQKVRLATFLLRGDAERWWETARQRFGNREPLWSEFQTAFNERFFPDWVREQNTYEFIELEQGGRTVAQYEAEFTSLARFAPGLVSSEDMKIAKFQRGLRAEIRYALARARIPDFSAVVQRAYAIEKDQNESKCGQASRKGTELAKGPSGSKKRKNEMRANGSVASPPVCNTCGKSVDRKGIEQATARRPRLVGKDPDSIRDLYYLDGKEEPLDNQWHRQHRNRQHMTSSVVGDEHSLSQQPTAKREMRKKSCKMMNGHI